MQCKWNNDDCKNIGDTCASCLIENHFYVPKKKIRPPQNKKQNRQDGRMGSKFEYSNHKKNENIIQTNMTINSGATTKEKGDEQIRGIINIMEELKTQMPNRTKGTKTFTIQRKWLDKLHSEALKEDMEFWYLKFSFDENEGASDNGMIYVITEQDIIMSMVKTMVTDRKKALECDKIIDTLRKKFTEEQAKANYLQSELDAIKASKEYIKYKENIDNLFSTKE